jgi:hypothetical protein
MIRTALALVFTLLATPVSAFESINLTYLPNGGACDNLWHEVEWKNTTGATVTVTKVIISGIGTPPLGGQVIVNTGAWFSEVKIEALDGTYKTIALAEEQGGKVSAASVFDYDGSVIVQPGEGLVHRTWCGWTTAYYAWVYVLTR